jgi:DNA-binding transcriptional MocR family regulator
VCDAETQQVVGASSACACDSTNLQRQTVFLNSSQMLCMLLLEPGDGVLTEQYSYSHLVEHTLKLRGNHAVPVAMDALGVQPAALRSVLQASLVV